MVESVAIILTILLAFAIDAGWDANKERSQEKAFLVSLLNDFKETRGRIDESTDAHMRFIDLARQLLGLHGGDTSSIEPEALENMLSAVFFNWQSLYLPSGSRDALFASGDIEIIDNEESRAMLAAWPSVVADAAEDDILIANDVMNNLAPYLQSKIRTRNVVRISNSDAAELFPRIESVNYDALWNDPMFENLVTFRILNETFAVDENDRLSEAADEIMRVIEEELDR
nr:putative integron gene cassette protein [uncultured bacterium]